MMTKQHSLTDEICDQIRDSIPKLPCDEYGKLLSYDGQRILDGMFEEHFEVSNAEMRTAADWQLEQVIEWLNETISERGSSLEAVNIPEELREAMRPTQENNNE